MTEREVELRIRIWTIQKTVGSRRKYRDLDEYKYLKRRVTITDDVLLEMLRVVDYIDLQKGADSKGTARAYVYERGINTDTQLVVCLQKSVEDEEARNQLIADLKAENFLWEVFEV